MNLRKHFRWSLRTQVIAALFAGFALLLWQRGNAWEYAGELRPEGYAELQSPDFSSPDGTRVVDSFGNAIVIFGASSATRASRATRVRLQTFADPDVRFLKAGFMNDDTILATVEVGSLGKKKYLLFKRRFPEWWWGHFYRPEVWLLPFWLGLIVWTIRKDRAVAK